MDKRAFLAIALSILILVVYQEWVSRYYSTPTPTLAPEAEKKEPEKTPAVEQLQPAPTAPAQTKPVAVPISREVKDVSVETDNYIAVFTNQGARLRSFKFKKYRSAVTENSPPFDIVQSAPGVPFPLGIRWQTPEPFDDETLIYSIQGKRPKANRRLQKHSGFQWPDSERDGYYQEFYFLGFDLPCSIGSFRGTRRW